MVFYWGMTSKKGCLNFKISSCLEKKLFVLKEANGYLKKEYLKQLYIYNFSINELWYK